MPVTLELIENGRGMLYTFTHPWVMADLMALQDQDKALRDHSEAPLPAIVDVTNMGFLASGAINAYRLPAMHHPRLGQFLVVGANPFIRTLAEMIFKFSGTSKFVFFNTVEAALTYLRELPSSDKPVNQR